MSTDPRDSITTPEEFQAALTDLLYRAHDNGVSVEGGWECEDPDRDLAWDVTVARLARE